MLTFAGCAYAVVSGGRVNLERAGQIYSDVQELRQLHFKTEVPLVLMDPSQANSGDGARIFRPSRYAELQRSATAGELTGLYGAGTNLKIRRCECSAAQVVAFYDPAGS